MSNQEIRIDYRVRFAVRRLVWRLCGAMRAHDAALDLMAVLNECTGARGCDDVFGNKEPQVRAAFERLTTALNWVEPRWTINKRPEELPPGVRPYEFKT